MIAMYEPPFIAFAGNIGAGKSTAAKIVAEHYGFEIFYEPVLENRFLKKYYGDMKRWSFTLQMEFLLKRIEHHIDIRNLETGCVQDRSLIEDPEIFAKYLHGLGHMSDAELDLYFDYFRRFNKQVSQPNKIILLHTGDVNVLLRRISARGREEEAGITSEFLRGLNGYYETFEQVAGGKYELDVLKVDVSELDIRSGEGQQDFLSQVDSFLTEGQNLSGKLF